MVPTCRMTLTVIFVTFASLVIGQLVDERTNLLTPENSFQGLQMEDDDDNWPYENEQMLYEPEFNEDDDYRSVPEIQTLLKVKRENWDQLSSLLNKRNIRNAKSNRNGKRRQQSWNNLRSMWGKRSGGQGSSKPSWIQLRGMWGKRSSPSLPAASIMNQDQSFEDEDKYSERNPYSISWRRVERFLNDLYRNHGN